MSRNLSRRDLIRLAGGAGLAAGVGALARVEPALADPATKTGAKHGVKQSKPDAVPAKLVDGHVVEPQQPVPVLHETDVLVVGGGSAGVCAALAARQSGAKVTLVERYNHFGGLWIGGLVLGVGGLQDKGGRQVVRGIGESMLRRAEKLDRAVIDRRAGANPIVDGEVIKYVMVDMITEAGIDVLLHCWGVDVIQDGGRVEGILCESKSGRRAILAPVVVDATGDGDLFAAAGAEHETRKSSIGLLYRIGNLDKVDPQKATGKPPRRLGKPTPIPGINRAGVSGPETDGLDVAELTRMELEHRRQIWKEVEEIRHTPGYEETYLVETAPQLGVRLSRSLVGMTQLTMEDVESGRRFDDCIGVGGDEHFKLDAWQIPYGALVPKKVDGLLAAGRCVSSDAKAAGFTRVVGSCFVTGHAAGAAAALCVQQKCQPRDLEVAELQKILGQQDAYLGKDEIASRGSKQRLAAALSTV